MVKVIRVVRFPEWKLGEARDPYSWDAGFNMSTEAHGIKLDGVSTWVDTLTIASIDKSVCDEVHIGTTRYEWNDLYESWERQI